MKFEENKNLASYSSWKVGGPAEFYVSPSNKEELREALRWADAKKQNVTFIGGGTNVLISDQGIKGLVVHLKRMKELDCEIQDEKLKIVAGCGVAKSALLKIFLKNQLAPSLFLAGLPGDVGGGIAMNAGVSEKIVPREFCEITEWVEVMGLESPYAIRRIQGSDLVWSYRSVRGWQPGVIVRAGLSWSVKKNENILEQVKKANKSRLGKQPLELPSCGSVFRNSSEESAGSLIERAGLKGSKIGGAKISSKHANFIVNIDNASAEDIRSLITTVQEEVENQFQVKLRTEVVFLGF